MIGLAAHRVTNETYRWVSDARFHPSGKKIVATKRYFSQRSLGAGEGWEFDLPTSFDSKVAVGSGKRLVSRTLPPGWGPEDYGEQQIGPEQLIWQGEDSLIWAKNVIDSTGSYSYSKGIVFFTVPVDARYLLNIYPRCTHRHLFYIFDKSHYR